MKLLTFLNQHQEERLGFFWKNQIFDLEKTAKQLELTLPSSMIIFLYDFEKNLTLGQKIEKALKEGRSFPSEAQDKLTLLAPVPHPPSCRDGYAFRQHVEAARKNRGMPMVPEFDQFPIFYFTNHLAICGPGELTLEADHFEKLDFELEAAIVIGKKGKNIDAKEADQHIAGLTIMNDFSARQLQTEEMKLSLGPAKGKDFATAIGPWLVTLDELTPYLIQGPADLQPTGLQPAGLRFNLKMKASHNEEPVSQGNLKDMTWTFAEIIERASYGVELQPGDVIGSGTVGTGCYMELNGTWEQKAKTEGKPFTPKWLKPGDQIELEIEGLGKLKNKVLKSSVHRSILAKKKNVPS
ncbi:MAG: fumarylacetoacetate hydrolase family protein [Deltaproteobacteria bacterium]|nr:fumarylacetoacetate hydrolase family protein [Deltaproteobacteria bacterium]